MQNTRQHILDFLETNRTASAIELSRAFRMTAANLRHHLSVLEKAGQVESVGHIPATGRGRPTKLYMRTPESQDNSLTELASALLSQIYGQRESRQRTQRLKKLAGALMAPLGALIGTTTQRLGAAVERLNELRYKARWEAHAHAPRLILGQCPYAAIIESHPELCRMDAYLLEGLLDSSVRQTAKLGRSPEDPQQCVFIISG
ncbi:MAG: helix-turn-helix domain-containing protein [Chloroflexi bacterium]|nr:helix-turn-helix domain-containing protein [Chloroflexota bacterium]